MLLAGNPLHAFDLDRIEGGRLVVRRARPGEQITTLDDVVRTLDDADAPHRGRRRADVGGRRHGRTALRGPRRHDARADGGRQLERPQHPPHLAAARPAQRGQRALREGPRARAGDGGPDRRHAADDRPHRRAPGPGHHRRRRAGAGAGRHPAARAARRRAARPRHRAPAPGRDPARAAVRRRGRAATASTSASLPSGATTSTARPTSSRRSRASTASRSCRPRCPSVAAAPGA